MSKQILRLAALDLDGTLLAHSGEVTPRTRAAIEAAVARGVVVVPATGRPLSNLPPTVASLPGVRYVITSNGAAVWDLGADPMSAVYSRYSNAGDHVISEPRLVVGCLLPVETARRAYEVFRRYQGDFSIFSDGRSIKDAQGLAFTHARAARVKSTEAKQPNDGRFTVIRDFDEWMSRNAHTIEKFCLFFSGDVEAAQAALPDFQALEGVEVVQGSPDNIEVTTAGADKGEGLLALANLLGIPREQTVAFGDSENDRAMLQKAGVAAVMSNGMEQIKAIGDIISEDDCDHDGVAELFAKLGLSE